MVSSRRKWRADNVLSSGERLWVSVGSSVLEACEIEFQTSWNLAVTTYLIYHSPQFHCSQKRIWGRVLSWNNRQRQRLGNKSWNDISGELYHELFANVSNLWAVQIFLRFSGQNSHEILRKFMKLGWLCRYTSGAAAVKQKYKLVNVTPERSWRDNSC